MNHAQGAALFAILLFIGIVLLLEIGRYIGIRRTASDPEGARAGVSAVDGAVFGLLGLLVAFTFSGAASRFDTRRNLIITETNAIGTAYLRLDLLPPDTRTAMQERFRRYVDSRLEVYRLLRDVAAAKEALARSTRLQNEIWSTTVTACRAENSPSTTTLLLSALNEMIDITTTRTIAAQTHPPSIIFAMLAAIALASALLAGYGMAAGKSRNWVHMLAFAGIIAVTVYVILDLEFPRAGFIRVDKYDQALIELRDSMK
jgi:hypothetical protein